MATIKNESDPVLGVLFLLTIIAWCAFGALAWLIQNPAFTMQYFFITQEVLAVALLQTAGVWSLRLRKK